MSSNNRMKSEKKIQREMGKNCNNPCECTNMYNSYIDTVACVFRSIKKHRRRHSPQCLPSLENSIRFASIECSWMCAFQCKWTENRILNRFFTCRPLKFMSTAHFSRSSFSFFHPPVSIFSFRRLFFFFFLSSSPFYHSRVHIQLNSFRWHFRFAFFCTNRFSRFAWVDFFLLLFSVTYKIDVCIK